MDEVDKANIQAQINLEQSLLRAKYFTQVERTGNCIWCSTKVKGKKIYCSVECRTDHENFERLKNR